MNENEWVDMDEQMNEWMNEWMDKWMNGWMDGWMDEWMNGDEWLIECMSQKLIKYFSP